VTVTQNGDALSKHLNCLCVSDECRSQAGRVFHKVGPDEQNTRGPMEAVSNLGMKSLLSSEEVGQIKWTGEHTLSSDILIF